jgi:hypothetical protein
LLSDIGRACTVGAILKSPREIQGHHQLPNDFVGFPTPQRRDKDENSKRRQPNLSFGNASRSLVTRKAPHTERNATIMRARRIKFALNPKSTIHRRLLYIKAATHSSSVSSKHSIPPLTPRRIIREQLERFEARRQWSARSVRLRLPKNHSPALYLCEHHPLLAILIISEVT